MSIFKILAKSETDIHKQGDALVGLPCINESSSSSSIISANPICLSIIALRTDKLYLFQGLKRATVAPAPYSDECQLG